MLTVPLMLASGCASVSPSLPGPAVAPPAIPPLPVQAQAEDIEPREQHGLPPEEVPPELNEVDTIMAFDDKTALEEWARAKGIELDRRKSLANLKQETLQFLGHQTEG